MDKLITPASSINRALDQIGDKWCLLILQEVFWGINSFSEMKSAMGVSKGVLSDRLKWLQSVDCLSKQTDEGKRPRYHLTGKSIELYDCGLMAIVWERQFFNSPELDNITLVHSRCDHAFKPEMRCRNCKREVKVDEVSYKAGPGATLDERDKKVRRRSSIPMQKAPLNRSLYKNLINLIGDRWTANIIALAFRGFSRFDQLHQELPVATNILSNRLRFLVKEGVLQPAAYQERPVRHEYLLTDKGEALYPLFLSLLQWGDKWCSPDDAGKPVRLTHKACGRSLRGLVICSACGQKLKAHQVQFIPE
ncbi:MAG: winged helix-turn-helix transcriptional regulator [Halioglobus sp.]